MITETKFYYQSSINGNFDISKIKLALSDFSEIDDVPRAALGFDVLHVKKVYNNKLFLEEINKEVDVNIEYFIISPGFARTCFTFKENIKKIWDEEDNFKSFILKERKFKDSKFQSFDNVHNNLFNEKILQLPKILPEMTKQDNEESYSLSQKSIKFKKTIESNSCLQVIGIPSFLFSTETSSPSFKIESEEDISTKNYSLIIDYNQDDCSAVKVYRDKDNIMYFKGNSEVFEQILCEQSLAKKKIREIISYCRNYISSCADIADQILSRIKTTNPVYWKHISVDVESLQLLYIKTQNWITTLKANIEKENIFKEQYTKDYYFEIDNEFKNQLSLINSLESQVDASLINISTPIKSRNDFKLQESTERGNDRILFLSFIAMSIPLISYIFSDTLDQKTKLFSGIVIATLPFLYFIFSKWYNRRLTNSYKKDNLEAKLVEYRESIKLIKKQIKDYMQKKITEDETTTRIEGSINDFIGILNQSLEDVKNREKRIKEKLGKYKRYKFE